MLHSVRCQRHTCGAVFDIATDGNGRAVAVCPQCERKRNRLCRDCPSRTPSSRHIRCEPCAVAFRRHREAGYDNARRQTAHRRKQQSAQWRRRMSDPAFRARRAEYAAKYRAANRDEYDRLYQREIMRRRRADPGYRARELKLRRAREARRRMEAV